MPLPAPQQPTGQILPIQGAAPYSAQMSFSQMLGRVISENPDSQSIAPQWLNDAARMIYDRRNWFPLMIRGQINSPQIYNTGTATVTNGSTTVTGIGTNWTSAMVGRQFRVGFNAPIYTITAVNSATSLTLELPWGWNTLQSTGYYVAQYYYNIGGNVKYIYECLNLLLGYRMWTNLNQRTLDSTDPWRAQQFSPYGLSPRPLDQCGNYVIEMYPVPIIQQSFPYMAFIQPPNLINDNDYLPGFIRGDIVVRWAISEALVWRGPKKNPYYNLQRSMELKKEFYAEIEMMARADENLYRQDVTWQSEQLPMFNPGGALWAAITAAPATMSNFNPLGGWGW